LLSLPLILKLTPKTPSPLLPVKICPSIGIFDKRPLIWFHYVLLVGAMFVGFYFGEAYLNLSQLNPFQMFIFWYIIVSISDQLIHFFIGVD
jgi:hypothetical protein